MSKKEVVMPRVIIKPGTEAGVIDVELTKPSKVNTGNPSNFPLATDPFKGLNYQTAAQSELNEKMQQYYVILSRVMAGTANSGDMSTLEVITAEIREYVLTDEDYNLVIGALQNMQSYILKFMYTDITSKAKAMDTELNKVIDDVNRFMLDLETVYAKSPADYPIPDNSVLRPKLASDIRQSVDYIDAVEGIILSASEPARPQGRKVIWYNTGKRIGD